MTMSSKIAVYYKEHPNAFCASDLLLERRPKIVWFGHVNFLKFFTPCSLHTVSDYQESVCKGLHQIVKN